MIPKCSAVIKQTRNWDKPGRGRPQRLGTVGCRRGAEMPASPAWAQPRGDITGGTGTVAPKAQCHPAGRMDGWTDSAHDVSALHESCRECCDTRAKRSCRRRSRRRRACPSRPGRPTVASSLLITFDCIISSEPRSGAAIRLAGAAARAPGAVSCEEGWHGRFSASPYGKSMDKNSPALRGAQGWCPRLVARAWGSREGRRSGGDEGGRTGERDGAGGAGSGAVGPRAACSRRSTCPGRAAPGR